MILSCSNWTVSALSAKWQVMMEVWVEQRAERLMGEWPRKLHSGYEGEKQNYMAVETAMVTGSVEDKAESGDCGFIAAPICLVRKCLA